jgi:hypothetical protein
VRACVHAHICVHACVYVCANVSAFIHPNFANVSGQRFRIEIGNCCNCPECHGMCGRMLWHTVLFPACEKGGTHHLVLGSTTTWYSAVPPLGTRQYHHLVLGSTTTWYSAVPTAHAWIRSPVTICCNVMFASGERLFTGRAAGDRRRSPRCCSCTASTCTRRMCGGAFSSRVRPSALPRAHSVARVRSLAH